MKKLLLSIIVLASLTSQARPADYTRADALDAKEAATAGYCNQYNETALRAIYKNLANRLLKIKNLQAQCSNIYKRASILGQDNITAGAAEMVRFDACESELNQMLGEQASLAPYINEVNRFANEAAYVSYHTRRGSAEACASSYQQTNTLKALLNL